MKFRKPPVSILIIAALYILVGAVGFIAHVPDLKAHRNEAVLIEVTELLAVLAGISILWGHNWARWLAVAWMAFHVIISFPELGQLAVHLLFLAVIAWVLFRPAARRYFALGARPDA